MHRRVLLLLALIAAAFSCREPESVETFVFSDDAPMGIYKFDVDLGDSLRVYDIALYGRLDGRRKDLQEQKIIPVDMILRSPSDSVYGERIFIEAKEENRFSASFRTLWRRSIVPSECGIWHLEACVGPKYDALTGLGIIVSHKDR